MIILMLILFFIIYMRKNVDLKNLVTIWINHNATDEERVITNWEKRSGSQILEGLKKAGSKVIYLQGDTSKCLEKIIRYWEKDIDHLKSLVRTKKKSISHKSKNLLTPSLEKRVLTTTLIFSYMGIGKEVVQNQENLLNIVRNSV